MGRDLLLQKEWDKKTQEGPFSLRTRKFLDQLKKGSGEEPMAVDYLVDVYVLAKKFDILNICIAKEAITKSKSTMRLIESKYSTKEIETCKSTGIPVLGSCIEPTVIRKEFFDNKKTELGAVMELLSKMTRKHSQLLHRTNLQAILRHL